LLSWPTTSSYWVVTRQSMVRLQLSVGNPLNPPGYMDPSLRFGISEKGSLRIDLHHAKGVANYVNLGDRGRNGVEGDVEDIQLATLADIHDVASGNLLQAGYVEVLAKSRLGRRGLHRLRADIKDAQTACHLVLRIRRIDRAVACTDVETVVRRHGHLRVQAIGDGEWGA